MRVTDTVRTLCALPGPSGWEDAVREYLMQQARPYADEMSVDLNGNLLVFKKGRKPAPEKLLLAAHMDEVGVLVKQITDQGYVKFDFVGGVDTRVALSKKVLLGEKSIPGVIGLQPIHLAGQEGMERLPESKDLYIDIGAKDKDAALELVQPGDYGVFDPEQALLRGGMLRAKAIDDRVGCAVLLELLKEDLPTDVWFAFTVQEEVGCRGAQGAAFRIKPDVAIVLEGTTAADAPLMQGAKKVCIPGKGPVIPFMDGGSIYDRGLFEQLRGLAQKNDIPWQTKTWLSGGTDASAIQRRGSGARVGAISAAVRYIHSPSSVGCTEDFENMLRLLELYLEDFAQ